MSTILKELQQVLNVYEENISLITNEAQTKQYLVSPILRAMGYDVNNPRDVIAEFTADVAGKKGEKVDYVVKVSNEVAFLIECKHHTNKLETKERAQLERYFRCDPVESGRVAILTNGIIWKFFTDSHTERKLDDEPFYILNLKDKNTYSKLDSFTAESFDTDKALKDAKEKKEIISMSTFFDTIFSTNQGSTTEEYKRIFNAMRSVSDDIDFGVLTENKIDSLKKPFLLARDHFITNYVNKKLSNNSQDDTEQTEEEFTDMERESMRFISAMISEVCDTKNLELRNQKGLGRSAILLDHNQRKPIIEMNFIRKPYTVWIGKEKEMIQIESTVDLFKYKDKILNAIESYMQKVA